MKKIILICFTGLFMIVNIQSQTEYKHFIGGSINTSFSSADFNTVNSQKMANQNVGFGFYYGFKLNKFSVGLGLNSLSRMQRYSNSEIPQISYSTATVMIYPFVRYYFNSGLFVHTQFNIGTSFVRNENDSQVIVSSDDKKQLNYWMIGSTIGLGYSIKVGDRFLIEPMYKVLYSYNSPLDKQYKTFKGSDILIDIAVIYKLL